MVGKSFSLELSRAKVNLTLHVLGKRSDGYHCLDSLVAFPRVGDEIYIEPAKEINLKIVGRLATALTTKDNLILRAASLLKPCGKGALIVLNKEIPISAGLGGGSSNAAVVLRVLSKLWGSPLPPTNELISLGADVPVCMNWALKKMQGVGEKVASVKEPPAMWIVLANTGEQVPTGLIFDSINSFSNRAPEVLPIFKTKEVFMDYLLDHNNDLELPATKLFPQIKILLAAIKNTSGCLISRMSGSGATCFGLFFKKTDAINACKHLAKGFPQAWIRVSQLFS